MIMYMRTRRDDGIIPFAPIACGAARFKYKLLENLDNSDYLQFTTRNFGTHTAE